GLTAATSDLVARTLREAEGELSAAEVGRRTGVTRVTARRYLEHLCADGRAELRLRYGSAGRPEHRYRWARCPGPSARWRYPGGRPARRGDDPDGCRSALRGCRVCGPSPGVSDRRPPPPRTPQPAPAAGAARERRTAPPQP